MRQFLVLAIIGYMLAGAGIAPAAPGRVIDIPNLLSRSTTVVVGRFTDTVVQPGRRVRMTVRADIVIKGSLSGGSNLVLGDVERADPLPPRYGMFFLRRHGNQYDLTDPACFDFPAAPQPFQLFKPSADPLDRVAAQLANVFALSPEFIVDEKSGLRPGASLVSVSNGRDEDGRRNLNWARPAFLRLAAMPYFDAETALRMIPAPLRLRYILPVLEGHGPILGRVWAYAVALEAGDRTHLHSIDGYLQHPVEAAGGTNVNLMLAFEQVKIDEQNASFFASLMKSPNERIREGAMYQLSQMQSPIALRTFSPALLDEDPDVRTRALQGICTHIPACRGTTVNELARSGKIAAIEADYRHWLDAAGVQ